MLDQEPAREELTRWSEALTLRRVRLRVSQEEVRAQEGSIRWEKRQKEFAVKRVLLQVNEQMPCCQAISHEFPDRCFDQIGRPPSGETAFDLFDAGDFSGGPDLLHCQHNLSIGRKGLAPGMRRATRL